MCEGRARTLGFVVAAVGLAALAGGRVPFFAFAIAVSILSAGELLQTARAQGVGVVPVLALAATISLLVVAHVRGERAPVIFPAVIVAALGVGFVALMRRSDRTDVTRGLAYTFLPILVVGLLGAYTLVVRDLRGGFRLVLFLLVTAAVAELAAATWDRIKGGHHLSTSVDSARTREGAGAGLAAAVLAAWIGTLAIDPPMDTASALVLGALVAVTVVLAELTVGMVARDADRPPSIRGRTFDRIDGVLFSAPVFFYAFRVLER